MKIYKRKIFWFVLIILILIGYYVINIRGKEDVLEFSSIIVRQQDLLQTVNESGRVVNDPTISLSFQVNGILQDVLVDVGDEIKVGDLLAQIQNTSQLLAVEQQFAILNASQAAYDLQVAGPKKEDIEITSLAVDQAMLDLEKSQNDLSSSIKTTNQDIESARLLVDDARIKLNESSSHDGFNILVTNAYESMKILMISHISNVSLALNNAEEVLGVVNPSRNDEFERYLELQDFTNAKNQYLVAADMYGKLLVTIQEFTEDTTFASIELASLDMNILLKEAEDLLAKTQKTLETAFITGTFTQSIADGLKLPITSSRTIITTNLKELESQDQTISLSKTGYSTAVKTVEIAEQKLLSVKLFSEESVKNAEIFVKSKEAALKSAEAVLALKISKPRAIDLAGLVADRDRARALYNNALFELSKTKIISPVSGIISERIGDLGEFITLNSNFVTIISDQNHIDVDISESDIAKVNINDSVTITLDAFGDNINFLGKVIKIDPSETDISGVIYYTIKVVFENNDAFDKQVKPGMTANISIVTEQNNNVLVIPRRAIFEKNDKSFIRKVINKDKDNQELVEVEITTGLRGDNGMIEIISGIIVDDEIVTFIKED